MDVRGASAIVTGGASGLGAATARRLAGMGAHVAVFDRDREKGTAVAEAIGGGFFTCDIADEASAIAAFDAAREAYGTARILVNCAGIGGAGRILPKEAPAPLADFERIVRVNLIGTFNMLRLAAAGMANLDPLATGERGVIISTASVAAYEGQIGQAAYSASKGGIVSLTLPAARELARFGIRVMAVAPGLFLTPLLDELPEEAQRGLAASIPFPSRLGEPSEFAQLVADIVANPYLNGETIRLDAALRMQPR